METFRQDLKYALTRLRKRPGFTLVVVLTLALGIGGITAMFSVVNAALFHALPFKDDERLLRLYDVRQRGDGQVSQVSVSPRNFYEVKDQAKSFESVVAQIFLNLNLVSVDSSERVVGIGVSENWLSTLGVRPALGRGFSSDEEQAGNNSNVVLVSHGFWQRRLGADPAALGKNLTLDDRVYTVIGVLPRHFDYPYQSELWLPWTFDRNNGRTHSLNVQARLKEEVTIEQAQVELKTIAQRLAQTFPETNAGYEITAVPLRSVLIEDGARVATILLAAVAFLLLLVCANVANLLLTHAIGRQREFAIRSALGASRARQLRQLLIESLMLSLAGGLLGFLATVWLRDAMMALMPSGLTYVVKEVPISLTVMGFGLGVSLVVGALLALIPALKATCADLNSLMKERATSASGRGERVLNVLVVSEVALALILLSGAALMIQNMYRLRQADLGVVTDHLLTLKISIPEQGYDEQSKRTQLVNEVTQRVENVPGVTNVTAANLVPLTNGNVTASIVPQGKIFDPNEQLVVNYRIVTPGYFDTLKLSLLRGRRFSQQDTAGSERVAIVSQSAAKRYWPGEDPVGRLVRTQRAGAESPWMKVVAVANDVKETTQSRKDLQETLYVPLAQDNTGDRTWATSSVQLAVRTSVDPGTVLPSLKSTIWQLDKRLTVFDASTAAELYDAALSQTRVGTVLLLSFSAFGLLLAVMGTYGVCSYKVGSRTRDIGIRMALGARSADVLWLIVKQGAWLALAGVGLGLAGAFALTRFMREVLTEVGPRDQVAFVMVGLALVAVALMACYVAARRATKIDPLVALKYE